MGESGKRENGQKDRDRDTDGEEKRRASSKIVKVDLGEKDQKGRTRGKE